MALLQLQSWRRGAVLRNYFHDDRKSFLCVSSNTCDMENMDSLCIILIVSWTSVEAYSTEEPGLSCVIFQSRYHIYIVKERSVQGRV